MCLNYVIEKVWITVRVFSTIQRNISMKYNFF